MKRITILALHLGYGGIERAISMLANSLVDKYEINIVSTYKLNEEPSFELNKNIKIEYLTNLKPNRSELKNSISHFNLKNIIKEVIKSIKILYYKKHRMISYIKNCDSDIIISTRDIHNLWLSKYGNKKSLKIGWEHNHHHGNMKYAKKIIKSVYNLDYLVLVSKELTNFYSGKLKKSKCQCVYIPNSIDFFPQEKSKLNNYNIISVGRLSKEKGYNDLIDVFKLVKEKNNNAILNIIGDGAEMPKIIDKINSYKLNNSVIMHGFKNRDDINRLLSNSSVYVMCSYTESFGIVLLEAFAYGIPCVAFDSAEGAREIIENNWNGYLIKDRNKEIMAKKICELLSNKNRSLIMGDNGLKKAKKYDYMELRNEWIKIIER